jgi:hypothetical protein
MTVTRDVAATKQQVWDVLADGWSYSGWVVGNSRIRAVSASWPAPCAHPAFDRHLARRRQRRDRRRKLHDR